MALSHSLRRNSIFDKFCVLSLTYSRSNGFITMLAPLRDYLRPGNPKSSPLLCTAKARHFTRMSIKSEPDDITYRKAQWITSEDVNVEHLLDVFMTVDAGSKDVWDACNDFLSHLHWHTKRKTVSTPKIEGLPDDHPSKSRCLFQLALLFESIGDHEERKALLTRAIKLERERAGR